MSKENLVTQVKLGTIKGEQLTTWIDSDSRIKLDVALELKGDKRIWRVLQIFDTLPASKINTHGWDNNNYDIHKGLFV